MLIARAVLKGQFILIYSYICLMEIFTDTCKYICWLWMA